MQEYQTVTHQFEPVFDEDSKVLILGTFPSEVQGAEFLLRTSAEPILEGACESDGM